MLQKLYTFGVIALSLGLLALGVGALLAPAASAQGYGVPTDAATWVRATGARDLILGLMTLTLWRNHPEALRYFIPLMLILPVADVILVLIAERPLIATLPHAAGTIGIGVLSILAWKAG
ncbi:MAG: DUF4267 domain-containing protein [Myxococcota bacterium]